MDEKTLAELIASTTRTASNNKGWFTAAEFAACSNRSRNWANDRLQVAVARGLLVCERRTSTNVLGEAQSKPMYRACKAKAKAGRA